MSNEINPMAFFQEPSVADLRLLACPGAEELTKLIDQHLVEWAKSAGVEKDSFIIPCECPRFQSGDAKGLVRESVRGDDIFIVIDPEHYQALLRWLEARPALKKLVIALNRWLPAVPFACYPLLLVLLNVRWFRLLSANRAAALDFMQLIARAVFVPAFVFLGGTLLRARLNFPRPYEQPGFTPLVPKETHGKSFPSRHALSAAVLAAVWCYFYPAAGACMVVVALLICALRVLAGAHYVRDVAAGALLGFALGAAGMYLL